MVSFPCARARVRHNTLRPPPSSPKHSKIAENFDLSGELIPDYGCFASYAFLVELEFHSFAIFRGVLGERVPQSCHISAGISVCERSPVEQPHSPELAEPAPSAPSAPSAWCRGAGRLVVRPLLIIALVLLRAVCGARRGDRDRAPVCAARAQARLCRDGIARDRGGLVRGAPSARRDRA